MFTFFFLLFLLSIVGFLVTLLKPKILHLTRKKGLIGFGLAIFTTFVLSIVTAPPSTIKKVESEQEVSSASIQSSATPTAEPSSKPAIETKEVKITKVIDGDTVEVSLDGKIEKVRLIGINTPETVDPRTTIECFGIEASNKAKEILNGKTVFLEADSSQDNRDKYQRLLRYVWLDDKTNFNKQMVSEGYAYEYTYGVPYKYQTEFKQVEKEARENKRGLWADNTCAGNLIKTPSPTPKPSIAIQPTATPKPKAITQPSPTSTPVQQPIVSYVCNCSKICSEMSSCNEAYYQLNQCGCSIRDNDGDGVPCESICPGG